MKMPLPDNSFDAVYAIEATCHAPDAVCASILYSNWFHILLYPYYNFLSTHSPINCKVL